LAAQQWLERHRLERQEPGNGNPIKTEAKQQHPQDSNLIGMG
jgi:hypothetical protein